MGFLGKLRYFREKPIYTDPVFHFSNNVTAKIADEFPDKYVSALAYYWCEDAPSFKIEPKLIPFLTADRAQYCDTLFVKVDNGIYEGFTPLQTKLYRKKKHKLVLNKKKGAVCYFSLKNFGQNSRVTIKVKRLKNGKYT